MLADPFAPQLRLPFVHLNLRRNPFGEMPRGERGELALVDVAQELVELLLAPRRVALQFMGDQGRGKTTHLLALHRHFAEAPYIYLAEGERRVRFPHFEPLFIDEAQRIPRWRRRLLFRRSHSFVLATHEDLSKELERAGFEVRTFEVDVVHVERLQQILDRRIEWVRRAPGPRPRVTLEAAQSLYARFGTNIRAMEGHLYDVFQAMTEIEDGQV